MDFICPSISAEIIYNFTTLVLVVSSEIATFNLDSLMSDIHWCLTLLLDDARTLECFISNSFSYIYIYNSIALCFNCIHVKTFKCYYYLLLNISSVLPICLLFLLIFISILSCIFNFLLKPLFFYLKAF